MLYARVFALGVLSDKDGIDVIVGCLVASNGATRSDVSKEIECPSKSQVQGNMAFTNWGLKLFSN